MTFRFIFHRLAAIMLLALSSTPLRAQQISDDYITLTLDEAIQIALLQNYAAQTARLDLEEGQTQVREALSAFLPNVIATNGYTRNLRTANPFAGSSAGSLFNSFGFVGWLAYNEDARTDDDPTTNSLTFDEYSDRIDQGMMDAGLSLETDENPFAVANQFQNTVTVSQSLFDLTAISALSALKHLRASLEHALDRQQQLVIDQVRQAFYQSLLFEEQAQVAAQSVERTRRTAEEATRRVAQGVAPKAQRLSAEVQLANLETQLVQTRNQAATALDNLKMILGIPVTQPVRLSGTLEADVTTPFLTVSTESAMERARAMRPDLQQLKAMRNIAHTSLRSGRRSRFPTINAVANFSYSGAVPSNRTFGSADEDDPFRFTRRTNDFFSQSYWQPAISVGFSIQWSLFEGFSRRARIQQLQIALSRAEIDVLRAEQMVQLEVATALRNLQSAQAQILSQEKNVSNAQLNYTYARARLSEGVGTPLEERDASAQLDQSRINHLQAVYNFLIAQSSFETATGIPLADQSDFRLTNNLSQ